MSRRWGYVARAFAICLLLLAMSPLTVPFSTLDLATLAGQTGAHEIGSHKTKPSSEGMSLSATNLPDPSVLDRAAGCSPAPPTLTDRRQIEQRVLRI